MATHKTIAALFFLSISCFGYGNSNDSALVEVTPFGENPGGLKLFVYVPSNLPDSVKEFPLVVALHGCSQRASTIAKESGWNTLANKHHFIVAYPQQDPFNNPSMCFNWFRERDINSNGEAASIKEMIDYLADSLPIDTTSIHVYGLSAGAAMGVVLLANYPTTFEWGAILAGGPYKSATTPIKAVQTLINPAEKSPEEWGELVKENNNPSTTYPKLITVHGKEDIVVDIKNSYELIDQWSNLHQTDTIPNNTIISFENNSIVNRSSYLNKNQQEVIIAYWIENTGHKLLVDPGDGEKQGGKTGLFAIDKDFFSTYYIAKDFGLIK